MRVRCRSLPALTFPLCFPLLLDLLAPTRRPAPQPPTPPPPPFPPVAAPQDKAIVFSQYRTMLDLVEWRLRAQSGLEVVKLVGSQSLAERRAVLANFKTNPAIKVTYTYEDLKDCSGGVCPVRAAAT